VENESPALFASEIIVMTRQSLEEDQQKKQLVSNSRPRKSHIWEKKEVCKVYSERVTGDDTKTY
jgi:glycerol-3-phosphate cytidylyltransferase-like family protein